jgi:hypothetical protein
MRRFAIVGEGSGGKPTPFMGKLYNGNRQCQSETISRSESVKESDCAAMVDGCDPRKPRLRGFHGHVHFGSANPARRWS